MKRFTLGVIAVTTTSVAGMPNINKGTSTVQRHEFAQEVVEYNIASMTGKDTFPAQKLASGFVNKQKSLIFEYAKYANTWPEFVQKYPKFKFNILNMETNLKGHKKIRDLSNVTFNTADFKLQERNGQFIIDIIESKYITDFIRLSVLGQVKEDKKIINFGVVYNINISQQYVEPYPFFSSVTDKIQFLPSIKN
ncbi:hypothetical protein [Spiroplasma endosymbiont of Poecilobothrus nobilitatus]|uniref:hypothetical protein n=1 Tax=Spiroplasma endosymbiont of Poecilobothrus nobilitatus TaxID=1209220 RepID=UPI00313EA9C4